ncbi:MAG: hypothetical protein ACOY3I_07715 [Verrucomicrobiota bacterium]
MNQSQRENLLQAVEALAGEHCHGFIFAAEVDCDDLTHPQQNGSGMIVIWDGGLTLATGLASRLYHQLKSRDIPVWEKEGAG